MLIVSFLAVKIFVYIIYPQTVNCLCEGMFGLRNFKIYSKINPIDAISYQKKDSESIRPLIKRYYMGLKVFFCRFLVLSFSPSIMYFNMPICGYTILPVLERVPSMFHVK